ncbi:MAG: hypothetical protein ACK5NT_02595 [Pyrinomonadaceae bacterium]
MASVEKLSEYFLIPCIERILDAFPFEIKGFHSDNGSEFINYQTAEIVKKLHAEVTKSRPIHSNDNAPAESKNATVVRKRFGHSHIPQRLAAKINNFNRDYLNPYLNFHRPCLFPKSNVNENGKIKKQYPYELISTPYEKLKSLPNAASFLKPEITFEMLDKIAYKFSDNEAASLLDEAQRKLFEEIMSTNTRSA